MRLRADLRWTKVESDLEERWRVKDPLALEYHEFGADERFLLEQFDGRRSLDEVRRRYNERFRPRAIRPERLVMFASDAHARGLLLSEGRGQGAQRRRNEEQSRRRAGWSRLFSLLFFRLPGVDPSPLLRVLGPPTRWLWSPVTMVAVAAAAAMTVMMLIGRASEVAAELPAAGDYLQAGNLVLLLVAFVAVKAAHELAHALACRHVGARCHELGLVLIALVPCPYCDVTDLWMIPSRARRMLVSAAGMYAEVIIATVCAWLWMLTSSDLLGAVLLSVMIACGVSTLIFNANPLLKLDGYFLLSDFTGASNLHERASRELMSPLAGWFRTIDGDRHQQRFDGALAGYALASLVYRVFVVVLLAMAAYAMLDSFGLRPVGEVLIGLTLIGVIAGPVARLLAAIRSPLLRRTYRWGRLAMATGLVAAAMAAVLAAPIPHSVLAPAVFEMHDARAVAAVIPGELVSMAEEGGSVAAGGVLARLKNPELERRRVRLAGELARAESRLDSLRRRTAEDARLLGQIPTAEATVRQAAEDLRQLAAEIERLIVRSPIDGMVVGVKKSPAGDDGDVLPDWQGRLVDRENAGCWVAQGDVLCLVAPDPSRLRATLMIDPADAKQVHPGLPTRVLAFQSLAGSVRGEIGEVARAEAGRLPETLRRHPEVLEGARSATAGRPLAPVLLARVELAAGEMPVRHASHGRCRIELASESVGELAWRKLSQAFPLVW